MNKYFKDGDPMTANSFNDFVSEQYVTTFNKIANGYRVDENAFGYGRTPTKKYTPYDDYHYENYRAKDPYDNHPRYEELKYKQLYLDLEKKYYEELEFLRWAFKRFDWTDEQLKTIGLRYREEAGRVMPKIDK